MIQSVVQRLKELGRQERGPLARWVPKIFRFLVHSNLLVALGAFSLAWAAGSLSGRPTDLFTAGVSFFYVHAMHILNRILDKEATAYTDPDKGAFLKAHRSLMVASGLVSMGAGLLMGLLKGVDTAAVLAALAVVGVLYSVRWVPRRRKGQWRFLRLKDIPGSRSLGEALAWVTVMCGLPLLDGAVLWWRQAAVGAFWVFLMSYARSTFFSLLQAQGDLIVGRETLPLVLGREKTMVLVKSATGLALATLALSGLLGWTGTVGLLMLAPVGGLMLCLTLYERGWIQGGIRLEAAVEGTFVLCGLMALLGERGLCP